MMEPHYENCLAYLVDRSDLSPKSHGSIHYIIEIF